MLTRRTPHRPRLVVALTALLLVVVGAPRAVAADPHLELGALAVDLAEEFEGARLVRDMTLTAHDISPGDNAAAEINRALYVDGRGWLYELDGRQLGVIIIEARTHDAATAFAQAQGTGTWEGLPDSFRGDRSSDTGLDLAYAGSVGRLVATVIVRGPEATPEAKAQADELAEQLYRSQRDRLPLLEDLSTSGASAIGSGFAVWWGTVSALLILGGVLLGWLLSVVTDRGAREWLRNRRRSPGRRHGVQVDLTHALARAQRRSAVIPVVRGTALAAVLGASLAAPSLQVWQSAVVVTLFVGCWTLAESWWRSRGGRSDVARGGRAVLYVAAGSAASTLVVVAGVFMMASAVAGVVSGHDAVTPFLIIAMLVFGLGIMTRSREPVRLARRLLQPLVRRQVSLDARAPILLLRSFQDDALEVRPPVALTGAIDTFAGEVRVRFEEVVAWAAWLFGPLRTFGQPGTVLQPLGAARDYHADEHWEEAIRDLADEAQAYILIAGRSPSLVWEIGELRANRRLAKTLIVFPPVDDGETSERCRVVGDALGLDRSVLATEESRRLLVLGFDGHGTPTVHAAAGRTADAYVAAVSDALERAIAAELAVGEPVAWARAHVERAPDGLVRFDPNSTSPRRTVLSRVCDVVLNFVPV
ncbi:MULTISPECIES: hypothetical protein [Aeromicrobium]|uniref:hypothetical protein n=1 Tax=Aeromicrobium TaxID=2040 RepID=UPI00257AEE7F|nr:MULTISPECIES: hypothetical protein [Aeromicrobium]